MYKSGQQTPIINFNQASALARFHTLDESQLPKGERGTTKMKQQTKQLQSIKFDVEDQDVAAMNTLTSDQATESDYQIDLVYHQSSESRSPAAKQFLFAGKSTPLDHQPYLKKSPARLPPQPRLQHQAQYKHFQATKKAEIEVFEGEGGTQQNGAQDSARSVEAPIIQQFMAQELLRMKKPQEYEQQVPLSKGGGPNAMMADIILRRSLVATPGISSSEKSTPKLLEFTQMTPVPVIERSRFRPPVGTPGCGVPIGEKLNFGKQEQKDLADSTYVVIDSTNQAESLHVGLLSSDDQENRASISTTRQAPRPVLPRAPSKQTLYFTEQVAKETPSSPARLCKPDDFPVPSLDFNQEIPHPQDSEKTPNLVANDLILTRKNTSSYSKPQSPSRTAHKTLHQILQMGTGRHSEGNQYATVAAAHEKPRNLIPPVDKAQPLLSAHQGLEKEDVSPPRDIGVPASDATPTQGKKTLCPDRVLSQEPSNLVTSYPHHTHFDTTTRTLKTASTKAKKKLRKGNNVAKAAQKNQKRPSIALSNNYTRPPHGTQVASSQEVTPKVRVARRSEVPLNKSNTKNTVNYQQSLASLLHQTQQLAMNTLSHSAKTSSSRKTTIKIQLGSVSRNAAQEPKSGAQVQAGYTYSSYRRKSRQAVTKGVSMRSSVALSPTKEVKSPRSKGQSTPFSAKQQQRKDQTPTAVRRKIVLLSKDPSGVTLSARKIGRVRSFTERPKSDSNYSPAKRPPVRTIVQNRFVQDMHSNKVELVQTIQPLKLGAALCSPESQSALGVTISPSATTRKAKGLAFKHSLLPSFNKAVDVAGTQAKSQRSGQVIKTMCLVGTLQHLSFYELSDLLQICRQTRHSKGVLKAQKAAYLNLVKKGQIGMDKVDGSRCRMWLQRLNITLARESEIRRQLGQQDSVIMPLCEADKEVIEADLRRTDFSMPKSLRADKSQIKSLMHSLLLKLSASLKQGYLQGMNYIVVALYRITASLDLTYILALKLLSSEGLTRVFLDETGQPMLETCNRLKTFTKAFLPRLSLAMERSGAEPDFFAQTWFITLLFHFQTDVSMRRRRKRQVSIDDGRVLESLTLDFLCLDGPKSLIKVPLCALQHLEVTPSALNPIFRKHQQKARFSYASNSHYNRLAQMRAERKQLTSKRQKSFSSVGSGGCLSDQSATLSEELDDECERLVAVIKRAAAEYMSGYTQLTSAKFHKEAKARQSMFQFFTTGESSLENLEQSFLVREFVESYSSFKVSEQLFVDLTAKDRRMPPVTMSLDDLKSSPIDGRPAMPHSIMRSDYLSNIKQGAMNTLNIGCNLFGFGSTVKDAEDKDQHHLSFTEEDNSLSQLQTKPSLSAQQPHTKLSKNSSPIKLAQKSLKRPDRLSQQPMTLYQKTIYPQRIAKQLKVAGDAGSVEHQSVLTRTQTKQPRPTILEDSSPLLKNPDNSDKTEKQADLTLEGDTGFLTQVVYRKQEGLCLPEAEDILDAEEQTMIANKIRISNIKGSHVQPQSQSIPTVSAFRIGGSPREEFKVNLRSKPQCSFERVPQQFSKNPPDKISKTSSQETLVIIKGRSDETLETQDLKENPPSIAVEQPIFIQDFEKSITPTPQATQVLVDDTADEISICTEAATRAEGTSQQTLKNCEEQSKDGVSPKASLPMCKSFTNIRGLAQILNRSPLVTEKHQSNSAQKSTCPGDTSFKEASRRLTRAFEPKATIVNQKMFTSSLHTEQKMSQTQKQRSFFLGKVIRYLKTPGGNMSSQNLKLKDAGSSLRQSTETPAVRTFSRQENETLKLNKSQGANNLSANLGEQSKSSVSGQGTVATAKQDYIAKAARNAVLSQLSQQMMARKINSQRSNQAFPNERFSSSTLTAASAMHETQQPQTSDSFKNLLHPSPKSKRPQPKHSSRQIVRKVKPMQN